MNDLLAKELKREVTVGVFAFAVMLGLFAFSIFVTGGAFWNKGRQLDIMFDNVMGLRKGDNVMIRGMAVGSVKALELVKETGKIRVTCSLTVPVRLKADCSATVVATSLLGGKHLSLSEGSANQPDLAEGTIIIGLRPKDLIADAGAIVQDIKNALRDGALDDMKGTLKAAREIADKINKGEGTLGLLINDKSLYNDFASAAVDIKAVTTQIKDGKGTLSKLINDDAMYADLKATTENLKEVSQRLADGKGFLGKLLSKDEQLYDDAKLLLENARAAVDDYRESSPILTFTSVLFGSF